MHEPERLSSWDMGIFLTYVERTSQGLQKEVEGFPRAIHAIRKIIMVLKPVHYSYINSYNETSICITYQEAALSFCLFS